MPPKTTTKAAADKRVEKAAEATADKPANEGSPTEATETTVIVTPPPEGGLEAAAAALATEAPPATMPAPPIDVGIDLAAPGGDSTVLAEVELVQDSIPKIRVVALHPVKHGKVVYGPGLPAGDELDVTPDERDDLVKIGAVEELS